MSVIIKCQWWFTLYKICCSFAVICHILSQCSRLSAFTSACATLFTFQDIQADSEELLSGDVAVRSHLEEVSLDSPVKCSGLHVQGYCTAVHNSLSDPYLSSALVLMWCSQVEYRWMSMKPYPPDKSEQCQVLKRQGTARSESWKQRWYGSGEY